MGGRVTAYLTEVTLGNLSADAVLPIVFFRLPSVIEVILPTSYFLAIILVFGRMQTDREMVAISTSGVSEKYFYTIIVKLTLVFVLILAGVSLWLRPLSQAQVDGIWAHQESASALTYLIPGTFSKSKSSDSLIYIAGKDGDQMTDFFMVESSVNANGERHSTLTRARNGNLNVSENQQQSFLVLEDGTKTVLDDNQAATQSTVFDEFGQVFLGKAKNYATRRNAIKTSVLIHSTRVGERAELYWRFSIALMLLIICPIAIPLSYVDPRMGKYAKLLPAVAIVLFYQASLGTAKATIEREAIGVEEGFLLVHSVFLAIVLVVCLGHTRFKRLLGLMD